MDEKHFNQILSTVIFITLIVLTFFIIRPIGLSIIFGLLLVFIFSPIYDKINKHIKNKNISSGLIIIFIIFLIVFPLWFLTPLLLEQSIKIVSAARDINYNEILPKVFPSIAGSDEFAREASSILSSFTTKTASSLMNSIADLIMNFPVILLHLIVVFFIFFFVMRDKENFLDYIKGLLPFSKTVQDKLFKSSRDITMSVIYGQIIVGIVQGLIVGIGFFIFGVPNALLITIVACIAGIFPILGPFMVWVPVAIYLLMAGDVFSTVGVSIFGIIGSSIDNMLRPLIVSRRTKIGPAVIMTGMIGGFFFLGILGLILGPLVLAYTFILLELYRKDSGNKKFLSGEDN